MELNNIDEAHIQNQAAAAGFATVELYIANLLRKDADRLAVQEGVDALKAGRHRPFDEFDSEFRQANNLEPQN